MEALPKEIIAGSILLVLTTMIGMNAFFIRRLIGKMDLVEHMVTQLALLEATIRRFEILISKIPNIESDIKFLQNSKRKINVERHST